MCAANSRTQNHPMQSVRFYQMQYFEIVKSPNTSKHSHTTCFIVRTTFLVSEMCIPYIFYGHVTQLSTIPYNFEVNVPIGNRLMMTVMCAWDVKYSTIFSLKRTKRIEMIATWYEMDIGADDA